MVKRYTKIWIPEEEYYELKKIKEEMERIKKMNKKVKRYTWEQFIKDLVRSIRDV